MLPALLISGGGTWRRNAVGFDSTRAPELTQMNSEIQESMNGWRQR